jgi:hypothetical protein
VLPGSPNGSGTAFALIPRDGQRTFDDVFGPVESTNDKRESDGDLDLNGQGRPAERTRGQA